MKYLSFIILTICFQFTQLHAQEDQSTQKLNVIKLSPFEFGKAEFQVAYERYFGNRSSSIIISPSIILKDNNNETKEGYQIMGQYRFYLSHLNKANGNSFLGMNNWGFYSGIYALYLDYNEEFIFGYYDPISSNYISGKYKKELTSFETGAIIGVQVDITSRFVFDFYIGGGVRKSDLYDERVEIENNQDYFTDYGVFDVEYQGVKPKIGFQIGITF